MLMLVGLFACLSTACSDLLPTQVDSSGMHMSATAAAAPPVRGCAAFEISLSSGSPEIRSQGASCGPLVPVLDTGAVYDKSSWPWRVRIPVRLLNQSEQTLSAPARLLAWEDSIQLVEPSDPDGVYSHWVNVVSADSAVTDSTSLSFGLSAWKYDAHLAASGETQALAPGKRSEVRWIEMTVWPNATRFQVRLHAQARPPQASVPATAPDTVPDWVFADSSKMSIGSMRIVKNVVKVAFYEGTPQAQREMIVGSIEGEVIGGDHYPYSDDGKYYVRVPAERSGRGLFDVVGSLRKFSQVKYASVLLLSTPQQHDMYRLPNDGIMFRRTNYSLNPDNAEGTGAWALSATRAPFGWGCETGSRNVSIAVVDHGYHKLEDLNYSTIETALLPEYAEDPNDPEANHGTKVASVLGARGDNGKGITGMMWNAQLNLYDYLLDETTALPKKYRDENELLDWITEGVIRAGMKGARVINLSQGAPYDRDHVPGTDTIADPIKAELAAYELQTAIEHLASKGHHPLIVVAAGNHPVDAKWYGFPQLVEQFPNQVIAVAAWNGQEGRDELWSMSARGDLVDIAAPGFAMMALIGNGTPYPVEGTSFAAPLVTGLAGLILSFDERLMGLDVDAATRNAAVLHWIKEGARRGGKGKDGIPVIDAYESLKAVAERPGAPLCGNPVWMKKETYSSPQTVYTLRGPYQEDFGAGVVEALFTATGKEYWDHSLNPLHGGKRVMLYDGWSWLPFDWSAASWTAADPIEDDVDPDMFWWQPNKDSNASRFSDGAGAGWIGWSHSADTAAWVHSDLVIRFEEGAYDADSYRTIGTYRLPNPGMASGELCYRRFVGYANVRDSLSEEWQEVWDASSYRSYYDSRYAMNRCDLSTAVELVTAKATIAYSPMGDAVLASVASTRHRRSASPEWTSCPDAAILRKRNPNPDALPRDSMIQLGVPIDFECRRFSSRLTVEPTTVYTIDPRDQSLTRQWTDPERLNRMAVLEGGRTMAVMASSEVGTALIHWDSPFRQSRDVAGSATMPGGLRHTIVVRRPRQIDGAEDVKCEHQYRDAVTGSVLRTVMSCGGGAEVLGASSVMSASARGGQVREPSAAADMEAMPLPTRQMIAQLFRWKRAQMDHGEHRSQPGVRFRRR